MEESDVQKVSAVDITQRQPLFVYGSLRPGELAHHQIADLVEPAEPAWVHGFGLWVRDGLPYIAPAEDQKVPGVLLHALPGRQKELYEKVRAFEGTRLYVEDTLPARTADGSIVQAQAFVGNQPDRGNPEAMVHGEWSSRTDPLFEYGMNAVTRLARELLTPANGVPAVPSGPVESDDFWERFVPLEGQFLVLCSVLERYMHLVYGSSVSTSKRIEKLWEDTDAVAAVKDADPPPLDVIDNRDPVPTSSGAPSSPFQKWYTVRSNLTHRGKGARHDFQLLARAVVGLHDTLRYLLARKLTPGQLDPFASEDKLLHGIVVD